MVWTYIFLLENPNYERIFICRADSREDNYWFLLYNKDDMPAVVAALEASSSVYDVIANAIWRNWNLTRGVDETLEGTN